MKRKNIKTVNIHISDDSKLLLMQKTFALSTLFYNQGKNLKVGNNEINCNHANYANLVRMQHNIYSITDITTK